MRFAVIGNPIAHSKSPQIHQAFAKQFGITLSYEKLLFEEASFVTSMNDFFASAVGCNITVPFKGLAYQYADELSAEATAAGAVNTLFKTEQGIYGHNTDGIGLVNDLTQNHHFQLKDKKVLIAGAGGATQGVIMPLLAAGVATITIANRTVGKAEVVVNSFNVDNLHACGYAELVDKGAFDLIINATSASLANSTLPLPANIFAKDGLAYDMFYSDKPTLFMQLASQYSMAAVDGLGMLVEQAAASFLLWHGQRPDTTSVIAQMRKQMVS